MNSMLKSSRGFNRVEAGAAAGAATAAAVAVAIAFGKTNVDNCDFTEQC